MTEKVTVVGAGLAGSEAAWQLANRGIKVTLIEMRDGKRTTPAHKTDGCAELVCSNSFRNDDITSAIGLLHSEMRKCNSIILQAADLHKVPAGSALAVDRDVFSAHVQKALEEHPNITIERGEISKLPSSNEGRFILATGPLTSDSLAHDIVEKTGEGQLAFFDAIAPIIYKESIDFSKAWFQSRYDKAGPGGDGKDYINCPMSEEQYGKFIDDLLATESVDFKEWEKDTPYFNGCLPIEVMASRGRETLRFGPMKPVGLSNPHSEEKPYAVVQLRQDNKSGSLYNMVGFQTKLKYGGQKEVFMQIPGLENAEFARLGGLHRNTFINSRRLLDTELRMRIAPHIRFAGQVTGVEGYVESAGVGMIAGMSLAAELKGEEFILPPIDTALGGMIHYITEAADENSFQPMNINWGLVPPLPGKKIKKAERGQHYSERAIKSFDNWKGV